MASGTSSGGEVEITADVQAERVSVVGLQGCAEGGRGVEDLGEPRDYEGGDLSVHGVRSG